MRLSFLLLVSLLCLSFSSPGQSKVVDSLEIQLDLASTNTEKVRLEVEIAKAIGHKNEATKHLENAEKLSASASSKVKALVSNGYAWWYYHEGDYKRSIEEKEKEVKAYRTTGSRKKLAEALVDKGKIERKDMQLQNALSSYIEAQEIFTSINAHAQNVDCLNRAGIIHKDLRNYAAALPLYYEAYELAQSNRLKKELSRTCINIGVVLKNQGKYDKAIDYYSQAESIAEQTNDYHGLGNIYNNLGNVLRLMGEFQGALDNYNKAIENRKKSGKTGTLGYTYNNMSLAYRGLNKNDKAIKYLKKAEAAKKSVNDLETLSSTYLNFTELYDELGDNANYEKYAALTEDFATRFGQNEILRELRITKGEHEANKGNFEKAYFYLSNVFNELDTIDAHSQQVLTSVLEAQFKDKQNRNIISDLSSVNDQLDARKKELERKDRTSMILIWALSIVSFVLIGTSIMLFFKQRAYAEQSQTLQETMISKEEKETLLKEIHHRVKNNLQIIKSLIRLQSSGIEHMKTETMLHDFEQRVSSMALVHESLYKSGDLANVDVNEYYRDLVNDLIDVYNLQQNVETLLNIQVERLSVDILIPLGLLTNEIISNSLKHAFVDRGEGMITVELKDVDETCKELYIGDNGKGFDFSEAKEKSQTLGLELIEALVEQLDGEFEFIPKKGSYFRVKFNCYKE